MALNNQFHHFIDEFVQLWENQLAIQWDVGAVFHYLSEEGPHLSLLPEEFLTSLDKYLYKLRLHTEKVIQVDSLHQVTRSVQALVILCRNLDNIPFIASCQLVSSCVPIASSVLNVLFTDTQLEGECISCVHTVCLFLEMLYDPYFRWRKSLINQVVDTSKIHYQPAVLHAEVVPFIYDCFHHSLVNTKPKIVQSLLYVLGAVITGAQHNASRAICPATVQILQRVLLDCCCDLQVAQIVLHCETLMVHILMDVKPEQCQMEIGEMMEIYQNTLGVLVTKEIENGSQQSIWSSVIHQSVQTIANFLKNRRQDILQLLLARTGIFDFLIMLLFDAKLSPEGKRNLASVIIQTLTAVLEKNPQAKEVVVAASGYQKLFEALKSLGQPDQGVVNSLLSMATDNETETDKQFVRNVEPIVYLIQWLPELESFQLQIRTVTAINRYCTSSLQSKALSCQRGIVGYATLALEYHQKLHPQSVQQLLRLIQSLGSHSVTATELKLILRLMRDASSSNKFPYSSYVLHCLSSMAKKDVIYQDCHSYFDIQHENDGIMIPDIVQWHNPGYGLSFCAWVRLDNTEDSNVQYNQCRRQLYSLQSNRGYGFESFFLSDGTLIVALFWKKEYITAMIHDVVINDQQWHSICISHNPSRRLFGQSYLCVFVDGIQRLMVNIRLPPINETFSVLSIGSPPVHSRENPESDLQSLLQRKMSENRLPALVSQMPNYFSLPVSLAGLRTVAGDPNSDPAVRTIQLGTQDSIWGRPVCLFGQIATFALFHEPIALNHARTFHDAGINNTSIFHHEDNLENMDFCTKVAFCISAKAFHNFVCMDISPNRLLNGHTLAPLCVTWDVKNVLRCIGGIQALFPILENATSSEFAEPTTLGPLLSPVTERAEAESWEILPSSSYADWKLEQNPVSGFLSLLRNVLLRHPHNVEELQRGPNIAIIGSLMQKAHPSLMDVQVLMAVQLLVEFAKDASDPSFLQSLFQHILFDMRIWTRSPFHVRIGHVQYLSNLIREDRSYFRKKYGVQYIIDVIKQHYSSAELVELNADDKKTMRQALLGILKIYINKEWTIMDSSATFGFLWSVRDDEMITEMLDVLLNYVESKHCKDQFYLLALEPRCCELLYALLLEKIYTTSLRELVLKLLINILKTDRAYDKSKFRLCLNDIGFQGLICLMQGQSTNMDITHLLMDIILWRDHPNSYSGALALAYALAEENVEMKLEFTKRLLAFILSRPNCASAFVKQTSWQECIARLLVKRPITASGYSGVKPMVPDLMDLDVETLAVATPKSATTPSSPVKLWNTTGLSNSGLNLGLALEHDFRDVAESVSNLVAGAVTGNLTNFGHLQNVAEVVADNLQNVAGNLQTNINSAMNSAFTAIRQKTLQVQGSLEELGETTLQRWRRKSHSSVGVNEAVTGTDSQSNPSPQVKHTNRYRYGVLPFEMAVDALNLEHRFPSEEDLGREKQRESTVSDSRSVQSGIVSANKTEFGQYESLDIDSYSLISEVSGQWTGLLLDPSVDPEDDLCNVVLSLYLVLLWRGIQGCSKEDWRERSQVLSCINLLGLNNELYRSHLEIKRRLIEMILQAGVNDLRQQPPNATTKANLIMNCQHSIRWVYDLVVLDPHEDEAKKMSLKLLESTLAMLDSMNVFQDEETTSRKCTELYHLSIDLILRFASSSTLDLCAMAAAKLHSLVQFRSEIDLHECAYLVYNLNSNLGRIVKENAEDRYACLIPVLKTVLEKVGHELQLDTILPTISPQPNRLCPSFFDDFQRICEGDDWRNWIERKIRPESDKFRILHLQNLPETMNRYWAESDEAAMLAVLRRNREVNESKMKFQMQILDAFRSRQTEEHQRYNTVLSHQRGHALVIRKKWRQLKQFLIGPRGAWADRTTKEQYWKLAHCENSSRMRLKLIPNPNFDPHIQASRLRDNTGSPVDIHSPDSLNSLLPNVANQALKRVLNMQEPEDSLSEEDLALAASLEKEELGEGKEKVTISEDCELVTLMSVIKGRFEITRGFVCFWDAGLGEERERFDLKWSLSQLQEVHLRRYNLRRSALEFFLTDHSNYFVNFTTKTRNRIYSRILHLRPPNLRYHSNGSPADILRSSGLTQRWIQREISNFDYLMQLNTIAGRTYNDLSQYPVFPWIIADYVSDVLDLDNPATFRDLSRPIGVVNPKNAKEVKSKYEHFEDPSGTIAKFHYGTHYSNAAGVLHYLVRMEPFTSLHIELQSGRFDVADRQFHSLNSTWRLLMDNPNDVKELIPEFFYLPEFLVNMNKLDLGVLQATKHRVDNVELPKWASSPRDFIDKHRQALESDFVSAHLHEWIDLIFGYKQRGPAAVEALNVFYYCSYEGAVDLDAIADPIERQAVEGMINHFGQTPCQLFKEPHPGRLSSEESLVKSKFPANLFLFLREPFRTHAVELMTEPRDWNVYISIPNIDPYRKRGYGYPTSNFPDTLVTVSRSGCIGLHAWSSHDRNLLNCYSLDKDPTFSNPRYRRRINALFHPSISLNNQLVAVSPDCKLLFLGGQLDNSIRVYALPRCRIILSAIHHIDVITCLALDYTGCQLITGSRDTTCIIWDISPGLSSSTSTHSASCMKPIQVLYGHDQSVTCVALHTALDMAVSGSQDGTVNIHSIKEGQYIRTLQPPQAGIQSVITHLCLSNQGDVIFTVEEKESYSIHAYCINGEHIGLSYSPFKLTSLTTADDYIITGDASGEIFIHRILGLKPLVNHSLEIPIEDVIASPWNTHLLVSLRDGRLVVIQPTVGFSK